MREGLAPIGTGLVIAGVISILRLTGGDLSSVLIALASAAAMIAFPRLPPLLLICLGGCITLLMFEFLKP
jgi:chromate transporter